MKILLVGVFLPTRLELSYERAFKALNCEIIRFPVFDINRFLLPYYRQVVGRKLYATLKCIKADFVLVMKGAWFWPKTIRKIRGLGKAPIFCFNGDDPFNLASGGASDKNILNSIPYYDCYFIWTKALIEPLLEAGAKRVEHLPFGFDSYIHHPLDLSEEERKFYSSDLAFLGSWDEEREYWLGELKSFDLAIWGNSYWIRRCRDKGIRQKWRGQGAYAEDMSKALSAAKISLNILRIQNKARHNMRTFEVPACRAFALAERSIEAGEFFTEDKEAVYFSTPQELKDKARYYLKHDEERERIAQAGWQRCLSSNYTYLERAKKILRIYNEIKG